MQKTSLTLYALRPMGKSVFRRLPSACRAAAFGGGGRSPSACRAADVFLIFYFATLPFGFAQGREPVERRLCVRPFSFPPSGVAGGHGAGHPELFVIAFLFSCDGGGNFIRLEEAF